VGEAFDCACRSLRGIGQVGSVREIIAKTLPFHSDTVVVAQSGKSKTVWPCRVDQSQRILSGGTTAANCPDFLRANEWPHKSAGGTIEVFRRVDEESARKSEERLAGLSTRILELLGFMNSLVAAFPDRELHVILDNLDTHKKNERWLKKHPKVRNLRRGIVHDFFYHIQVLPKGN
jgi:hypothetical protein